MGPEGSTNQFPSPTMLEYIICLEVMTNTYESFNSKFRQSALVISNINCKNTGCIISN